MPRILSRSTASWRKCITILPIFRMARKTYTGAYRYAQQSNIDRNTKVKLMHRMADIDMQSLDWRNAIRVFEQIRTMEPEDGKARDMLFDLNIRLGQENQAMSELDNYLNHLISMHRTTEALEYINTKIAENQNHTHPLSPVG